MSRSLLDQPLLHDAVEDLPALAVPPKGAALNSELSSRRSSRNSSEKPMKKRGNSRRKAPNRPETHRLRRSSRRPEGPRGPDSMTKNMKPELEALSLSAEARHGPARRSPAACRCWGGPNPSPKAFEGGETPPKTCSAPRFLKVFKGKSHHFIIISSKAG